jgi:hypothetical protein
MTTGDIAKNWLFVKYIVHECHQNGLIKKNC